VFVVVNHVKIKVKYPEGVFVIAVLAIAADSAIALMLLLLPTGVLQALTC
jgi:hypothetical protein